MGAWRNNPGFDAETFKKLVARFDSNHTGEAETAFRKAMLICVQSGLRFCDAATEAYGDNDRAAGLESELAGLREALGQRERQGAALADARDKLENEFAAYRRRSDGELERLRQNSQRPSGRYCAGCEWKRAVLAAMAGFPIAKLWFSRATLTMPTFETGGGWHSDAFGWLLVASPLLGVLGRWWWLSFKRRHSWVSRRDNDIYRRIRTRWNAFVQRLTWT